MRNKGQACIFALFVDENRNSNLILIDLKDIQGTRAELQALLDSEARPLAMWIIPFARTQFVPIGKREFSLDDRAIIDAVYARHGKGVGYTIVRDKANATNRGR
jgi:hypothetical protein